MERRHFQIGYPEIMLETKAGIGAVSTSYPAQPTIEAPGYVIESGQGGGWQPNSFRRLRATSAPCRPDQSDTCFIDEIGGAGSNEAIVHAMVDRARGRV